MTYIKVEKLKGFKIISVWTTYGEIRQLNWNFLMFPTTFLFLILMPSSSNVCHFLYIKKNTNEMTHSNKIVSNRSMIVDSNTININPLKTALESKAEK